MKKNEVLIITTAHDAEDGRLVRHKNVFERNGIRSTVVSIPMSSRVKRFVMGPIQAYLLIKKFKPDCVILPDPELHLLLPFFLKKKTLVISDVHEAYDLVIEDREWMVTWLKPFFLYLIKAATYVRNRWSDSVIVADTSLQKNDEIHVGNRPNSLDLNYEQPSELSNRVIYVGDIRRSRGLEEMLNLVEITPEIFLDLIGPCREFDDLNKEIEKRGLSKRVSWHGRLSYESSWKIASNALAGLSLLRPTPAFENSIPTKIWEYWAVGLPVLGSNLSGQARVIAESGGGFVGDVEQLSKVIVNFIEDPAYSRRIGQAGRIYFEENDDGSEERLLDLVRTRLGSPSSSIL